jgi:hypothetical protein
MGNAFWVLAPAVLLGSSLPAQVRPDFTGRWVLESPSRPAPYIPRALSVRQALLTTHVRGEPIGPFVKDITIEREFESSTTSETHQVGVVGGVVPGLDSHGRPNGPRQHHAVRWDANALVFESGTYTGESSETGVWTERREVWSLDADGRLHVLITTRSSVDEAGTVVLVFRRPCRLQRRAFVSRPSLRGRTDVCSRGRPVGR